MIDRIIQVCALIVALSGGVWAVMRVFKAFADLQSKVDLIMTNCLPHMNDEIEQLGRDLRALKDWLVQRELGSDKG